MKLKNKVLIILSLAVSLCLSSISYADNNLGSKIGDISLGNHKLAPYSQSNIIVPRPTKSIYGNKNTTYSENEFSDIRGHWAESYIKTFAEKGCINGYPDGTFKPDKAVTYAEIAGIFAGMNIRPVKFNGGFISFNLFSNYAGSWSIAEWFYDGMMRATEGGMFGSYAEIEDLSGEGNIFPLGKATDFVKREYVALFLNKMLETGGGGISEFKDSQEINSSSDGVIIKAVNNMISQNIINGYPDNTFRPKNTVTRAELVVMFTKILDKYNWNTEAIHNNLYANYHQYFWNQEEKLLELVNAERIENGLTSLKHNPDIDAMCHIKMFDKELNGYENFRDKINYNGREVYSGHISSTYGSVNEMAKAFGLGNYSVGENTLNNGTKAEKVHERLTKSEAHRENYMDSRYIFAGFAMGEKVSYEMFAWEN